MWYCLIICSGFSFLVLCLQSVGPHCWQMPRRKSGSLSALLHQGTFKACCVCSVIYEIQSVCLSVVLSADVFTKDDKTFVGFLTPEQL